MMSTRASDVFVFLEIPADRFLQCRRCGITFVWTGWQQLNVQDEPDVCPGCQHLLKLTRRWGVVKWFDPRRGYGFITMTDGADVFVRRRDVVKGRLRRGQLVSFRVIKGKSGDRAIQVRVHSKRP